MLTADEKIDFFNMNKINTDVVNNFMKSIDIRLLDPINDIDIEIYFHYEYEIHILYRYRDNTVISITISATYVILDDENNSTMMYYGDGEELSVKERLFSSIMDILNRIRGG